MKEEIGDTIMGVLMGLFGLIGLFMAAGARDAEIYLFGLSLAGFAVLFLFGLIRRHYDEIDEAAHVDAGAQRAVGHD